MNIDNIRQRVIEIVARTAKIDPSDLVSDVTLEAIGVESIDVIDIIFHCEDAFSIDLDGSDLASSEVSNYTKGGFTIDDLAAAIQRRVPS